MEFFQMQRALIKKYNVDIGASEILEYIQSNTYFPSTRGFPAFLTIESKQVTESHDCIA